MIAAINAETSLFPQEMAGACDTVLRLMVLRLIRAIGPGYAFPIASAFEAPLIPVHLWSFSS